MLFNSFHFILLIINIIISHQKQENYDPQLLYGWNVINFTTSKGVTECKTCMPAGIKLDYKGNIYVSFPRWKDNVIATLAKLDPKTKSFIPWPSESENDVSDPKMLQSVLGFEIHNDTIYVLDQGIVNQQEAKKGSMKVVVYNVNGTRNTSYDLTNMTNPTNSFLNDIVIDPEKKIAYISDSGNPLNPNEQHFPQILKLYLNASSSEESNPTVEKLLEPQHYSLMPEDTYWLTINGKKVNPDSPMKTGVDGIALSCDYKILYYTPLTSKKLYSLNVDTYNQDEFTKGNIKVSEAYKNISSDGILASKNGVLYMTSLEDGRIYIKKDMDDDLDNFSYKNMNYSIGNDTTLWPDTLALFNSSLYFISNQLHLFIHDETKFDDPSVLNFRIYNISIADDDGSYIEGCRNGGYSWTITNIVIWIVFAVLILVVLSFVLMSSHKQEESVDKHMSIGLLKEPN